MDLKTRGEERPSAWGRESWLWLLCLYAYLSLGLSYVNWASLEWCLFRLRSSLRPRTFFCFIFKGFSLPCLVATAILDSFSLFYIPNSPPSRDGRPSYLGIGASRSFWLLPAELGQRGVLGPPLAILKLQSPYSGVHLRVCDIFCGRL